MLTGAKSLISNGTAAPARTGDPQIHNFHLSARKLGKPFSDKGFSGNQPSCMCGEFEPDVVTPKMLAARSASWTEMITVKLNSVTVTPIDTTKMMDQMIKG
jgi:hypothetical protein